MPTKATLDKTLKVMKAAPGPVTRTDILGVAPRSYVRAVGERAGAASMDAERFAAARLIWRLAQRGGAGEQCEAVAGHPRWGTDRRALRRPQGIARAAVAIARGRVVATWTHKQQRGRLVVEVQPLSRWQTSKHAAQVRREAQAVAAHLDLDAADITIAK